jgi:hypothetical protein
VNASLIVSPISGLKGDTVTLEGYGFGDEVNVDTIKFDDSLLGTIPSTPITESIGSWTATFSVPDKADGDYNVTAEDALGNNALTVFKVSPTITLGFLNGSVGTVVTVIGRGFSSYGTVTSVTFDGINCWVLDSGDLNINGNGVFEFEILIPSVDTINNEYIVEVGDDCGKNASSSYLVTGITSVELEPQFGGPGTIVGVMGNNYAAISGSEVIVKFDGDPVMTLETNSTGKVSGAFIVPAKPAGYYEVMLEQQSYNIEANESYKLGIIIIIVTPNTGPTGTNISLTGTGFTSNGEWEAYFGDILIFQEMDVSGDTTLFGSFYVPVVNVGEYTITVVDLNEDIDVKTSFTVTGNTSLSLDPTIAPVGFNVTIEGIYFAESSGDVEVDFVIYNSTDFFAMEVFERNGSVTTGQEGEFTAWWIVPDDLSIGSYNINATDDKGLSYHLIFEVVSTYLSVTPHKSAYHRGDTVRFNIESSFEKIGSYIMISDPTEFVVWRTDDFNTWIEKDVTFIVPQYTQNSGGSPMILDEDAPLGTWAWTWYDSEDETLASGVLSVEEIPQENGDNGDNVTSSEIIELRQEGEDLEELVEQLTNDLQSAILLIESLSTSTSTSINDFESTLEDVADEMVQNKQDAVDAKAEAQDASTSASEAKATAEEAKSIASQAIEDIDETRADIKKALDSSNVNKILVFIAFLSSLGAIIMIYYGPFKISKSI